MHDHSVSYESIQQTVSQTTFEGMDFQKIPGDGHCLFHAIGLYLGHDASYLRRIISENMEHNFDEFKHYRAGSEEEEFREYIETIRNGKEWGDHIEIEIIQRITDRPVIIIHSDSNPTIPDNLENYHGDPIFIYYNGRDHYDAFILREGAESRMVLTTMREKLTQGQLVVYNPNPMTLLNEHFLLPEIPPMPKIPAFLKKLEFLKNKIVSIKIERIEAIEVRKALIEKWDLRIDTICKRLRQIEENKGIREGHYTVINFCINKINSDAGKIIKIHNESLFAKQEEINKATEKKLSELKAEIEQLTVKKNKSEDEQQKAQLKVEKALVQMEASEKDIQEGKDKIATIVRFQAQQTPEGRKELELIDDIVIMVLEDSTYVKNHHNKLLILRKSIEKVESSKVNSLAKLAVIRDDLELFKLVSDRIDVELANGKNLLSAIVYCTKAKLANHHKEMLEIILLKKRNQITKRILKSVITQVNFELLTYFINYHGENSVLIDADLLHFMLDQIGLNEENLEKNQMFECLLKKVSNPKEHIDKFAESGNCTLLSKAVNVANKKIITMLIEFQADLTIADQYNIRPLERAIIEGMTEILNLLDKNGAPGDQHWARAMFLLSQSKIIEFEEYIDKHEVNVDYPLSSNWSLLCKAVRDSQIQAVEILLKKSAYIKSFVLFEAIKNYSLINLNTKSIFDLILAKISAEEFQNANQRYNILYTAAADNLYYVCEQLLLKGIDIKANVNGIMPIEIAGEKGHTDIVKLLEGQLNSCDIKTFEAFNYIKQGDVNRLQNHLANKIDFERKTREGKTLIEQAINTNRLQIVQMLWEKNSFNIVDLVFYAMQRVPSKGDESSLTILKFFLDKLYEHPKKLELINQQHLTTGSTLLILATQKRLLSICKSLLEHGADPSIRNNHGGNASNYAIECDDSTIYRLIENKMLLEQCPINNTFTK